MEKMNFDIEGIFPETEKTKAATRYSAYAQHGTKNNDTVERLKTYTEKLNEKKEGNKIC